MRIWVFWICVSWYVLGSMTIAQEVQWEERSTGGVLRWEAVDAARSSDVPWMVWKAGKLQFLRFFLAASSGKVTAEFLWWDAKPVADSLVPKAVSKNVVPMYRLESLGWQRGRHLVALTIVPFIYDTVRHQWRVLQRAAVAVKFPVHYQAKVQGNLAERALFANVVNPNQAVRLSPRRAVLLSEPLPPLPFPKGHQAVKLMTSRDGIAFVPFEEIQAIAPTFANQPLARLHLYYKARPVPYLVLGDHDQLFNSGDTLVFLGFHPSGDTVWFSSYATHTAFFLVLDSTQQALRYIPWEAPVGGVDTVRKIWGWEHFEEDHYVSVGFKDHVTGDEDWSWTGGLRFGKGFTYPITLYPADTLIFRCQYRAISDNLYYKPDHYPQFLINDSVVAERQFDGRRDDTLVAVLPATAVRMGENRLRFYSAGVPQYRERTNPPYTDMMYLDYFEVEGWMHPVLVEGTVRGWIPQRRQPGLLALDGSSHFPVLILDTTRRQFRIVRAAEQRGVRIALNVQHRTIAVLDTHRILDTVGGAWGVVISAETPEEAALFELQQQQSAFAQAVAAAPDSSVVVFLWNTPTALPLDVMELLQNLGAQKLPLYQAGERYAIVIQKSGGVLWEYLDLAKTSALLFAPLRRGRSWRIVLPLPADSLWLIAAAAERWEKAKVRPVKLQYWRSYATQVDYIVVTHQKFWEQAQQLAAYRAQRSGVSTLVVDVESLYDEFFYGEKNPHAIKWFLKAAFQNWPSPPPSYVVFFGDASWDPRKVWEKSVKEDYVPSYGKPVSDYWYTLLDPSPDILPELLSGRIPVETVEEAQAVVEKIIEYESLPQQPWMRHALFLTGGETQNERFLFRFDAEQVIGYYTSQAPLCMTAEVIAKANDGNVDNSNATVIRRAIDRGAFWVNYVGHAAPTIFDMDFGWAKDFNNAGKYPILATFSCQTGAFAEPTVVAKNEDFLRGNRRGMIACYGTTGFGYVAIDRELLRGFFEGFRDSVSHFGDLLQYAKMWTLVVSDTLDPLTMAEEKKTTFWQYTLLGDPMGIIAYRSKADPYVLHHDFAVFNEQGGETFAEEDTVAILKGMIRNGGVWWQDTIPIRIVHTAPNVEDTLWFWLAELCGDREVEISVPTYGIAGLHTVTLSIDPEHTVEESNRENNTVQISFTVFSNRLQPLDPLPHWNVAARFPRFRVMRPAEKSISRIEWQVRMPTTDSVLVVADSDEVTMDEEIAEWRLLRPVLEVGKSYVLWVRAWEEGVALPGEWLQVPFFVDSVGAADSIAHWRIRSPAEWTEVVLEGFQPLPDSSGIVLHNVKVPLEVYSDGRGKTRRVRVRIAGREYLNSPFARGFNVFVIPPDDSVRSLYRRYDTYLKDAPIQKDVYGDSEELVRFLEDSVQAEDRILIALCDNSVRGILQKGANERGNFADVVRVLQLYGAEYAESLQYGSSYILFAKRGKKFRELWKRETAEGNTAVELQDSLEVQVRSGSLVLPIIPHVRRLRQVRLETNGRGRWRLQLVDPARPDSLQLVWEETGEKITFPPLPSAAGYQVRLEGEKTESEPLELYSVTVEYEPLPELSVFIVPQEDTVVQGFVGWIPVRLRNLSLRATADSCTLDMAVFPSGNGGTAGVEQQHRIAAVLPEAIAVDTFWIATLDLAWNNRTAVAVRTVPSDIYRWNNQTVGSFAVVPDTVPPTITVWADGVLWSPAMLVRQHPRLKLQLWDNAPLPVQLDRITVFVNGVELQRFPDSVVQMISESLHPDPWQRVPQVLLLQMEFTAPFRTGRNTMHTVVEDYFGNRDTIQHTFVVPELLQVEHLTAYPHPASERIHLRFTLKDRQLPVAALRIYDLFGRRLYEQQLQLQVGENEVVWELVDQEGAPVASGTYLLVLIIENAGEGQHFFSYPVQVLR